MLICQVSLIKAQDNNCACELKIENEKKMARLIGNEYIEKYQNNSLPLFSEWSEGEIISTTGEKVENEFLLYNILLDEVIWMRSYDHQKALLDRRFVKEFTLHPRNSPPVSFIKTDYKNRQHPENNSTYMQILWDGNTGLYKYIYAIEASYTSEVYLKENYFLLRDNTFSSFSLRQKSFFELFGNDKKQIKQIFRNNHLSVRKEDDLIRGIELYNTLPLN